MDLVSVIIPVFNGENFLEQNIESIINQDYKNIEIIAIDDNSSDRSSQIIQKISIKDYRIRYYKNPVNLGFTRTVNVGISHSTGKFILVIGQDDMIERNHISTVLKYFSEGVCAVYTNSIFIDERGKKKDLVSKNIKKENLTIYDFSLRNQIHSCGLIMKRDYLLLAGSYNYDPRWRNFGEWDLWIRLLKYGNIKYCDEVNALYRKHSSNMYYSNSSSFGIYRKYALNCMRLAYSVGNFSYLEKIKFWNNYIIFKFKTMIKLIAKLL